MISKPHLLTINAAGDVLTSWLIRGCCAAVLVFVSSVVGGQEPETGRRGQLKTPGMTLVGDAPTAPTNALVADGEWVFAGGLDHVVRAWPIVDGKLDPQRSQIYRWPAWREQRGAIQCLALSPDGQHLAIAGHGMLDGLVVELDRESGEVVRTNAGQQGALPTSCMVYDEAGGLWIGSALGEVYYWPRGGSPRQVSPGERSERSYLRALSPADGRALAVFFDGRLAELNLTEPHRVVSRLIDSDAVVKAAKFSPDRSLVAVWSNHDTPTVDFARVAVLRCSDGSRLWYHDYLASQPAGVDVPVVRDYRIVDGIEWESSGGSLLISVRQEKAGVEPPVYQGQLDRADPAKAGPPERTAVEIDGTITAYCQLQADRWLIAGGDAHALFVQNLDEPAWLQTLQEPNAGIRSLAWGGNEGGRPDRILWRSEPNLVNPTLADRGAGPWRAFELRSRRLGAAEEPPPPRTQTADGWHFESDAGVRSRLSVIAPNDRRWEIPLTPGLEDAATAARWLPRGAEQPPQLVVGHMWGASVFEMTSSGPQRIRLLTGHQGRVLAIAPSPDGRLVLTGGEDGTIACFPLTAWPSHPELGAAFSFSAGSARVASVDSGSPAWEAGLSVGDRIERLGYNGQFVPDVAKQLDVLRTFEVGRYFDFYVRRGEEQKIFKTSVRQRPLWKLRVVEDDWVLWRWRDYFYDCSTDGDTLIGWQINEGLEKAPRFLRAEQVRERYHRPAKLEQLLTTAAFAPERAAVPELVPPKVQLSLVEDGDGYTATVGLASADEAALVGEPAELSLWVGDHRLQQWLQPRAPYTRKLWFPRSTLREGENVVIARAYTQYGVRGDSAETRLAGPSGPKPRLIVVAVGIDDYSAAVGSPQLGEVPTLQFCVSDARSTAAVLEAQRQQFADVQAATLLDQMANKRQIFQTLAATAEVARPNDLLVLFLAGHGYAVGDGENSHRPDTFTFLTWDCDLTQLLSMFRTGVPFCSRGAVAGGGIPVDTLFDAVADLPCRKLLLLDTCHSGGGSDMIRALTPDFKVGPTVLVAAKRNQQAQPSPLKQHGIFTYALLEAFTRAFPEADLDQDELLSAAELHNHCQKRVPELLDHARPLLQLDHSVRQDPEFWAPESEADRPLFTIAGERIP